MVRWDAHIGTAAVPTSTFPRAEHSPTPGQWVGAGSAQPRAVLRNRTAGSLSRLLAIRAIVLEHTWRSSGCRGRLCVGQGWFRLERKVISGLAGELRGRARGVALGFGVTTPTDPGGTTCASSTAFNRLLQIPGAWVTDVVIGERDVDVTLRPRARLVTCPCGMLSSAVHDRRRRRWRHLDLGAHRLWLVYEIRRLECPDCGVRTEELPWARPGARHTRDFEDTVLWLAQRTDRTSVATLMRCGWETVTAIINHGVAELLDTRRLLGSVSDRCR